MIPGQQFCTSHSKISWLGGTRGGGLWHSLCWYWMMKPFTLRNRPKLSSLCDAHQEQAQVSAAPSKATGISPHLRLMTQFLFLTGGRGRCSYFCSLPLAQLSCISHPIVAVNSRSGRKPSAKRNMKWEHLRGDCIPASCRWWVNTSFIFWY